MANVSVGVPRFCEPVMDVYHIFGGLVDQYTLHADI
jgi:hypothetical protein